MSENTPSAETSALQASIRACLGVESRIEFTDGNFEMGPETLEGVYALGMPLQVEGNALDVASLRFFYSGGLLKDAPLSGEGNRQKVPLERITSINPVPDPAS